jgi:hypothetical protein
MGPLSASSKSTKSALSKGSSTEADPMLPIVGEITTLAIEQKTPMLSEAQNYDGILDGKAADRSRPTYVPSSGLRARMIPSVLSNAIAPLIPISNLA